MSVNVIVYSGSLDRSAPKDWAFGHLTDDKETPLCGSEIDDRYELRCYKSISEDATCPDCLVVGSHIRLTTFLYIIRAEETNFHKIGITTNIERRLKALQHATPLSLTLFWYSLACTHERARSIEREVHEMFADRRPSNKYQREWFGLGTEDVIRAHAYIQDEVIKERKNLARIMRKVKREVTPKSSTPRSTKRRSD